jgi:molecular chaperone DnaJ
VPTRPERDYYALLGVQATADAEELRRAWRGLASRWHPDRAGIAATWVFQQLSAAYAVLSDPLARAAYDGRRRAAGRAGTGSPGAAAPPGAASSARPVRAPTPGVMLSRLSKPLWLLLPSGAARLDDDGSAFVTLVLRPDEAAQGGMVCIPMRIDVWCPACAAPPPPRPPASSSCPRCGGSRKVEELVSAWLAVPPGVAEGEVLTPSADLPRTVDPVRFRVELFKGRS